MDHRRAGFRVRQWEPLLRGKEEDPDPTRREMFTKLANACAHLIAATQGKWRWRWFRDRAAMTVWNRFTYSKWLLAEAATLTHSFADVQYVKDIHEIHEILVARWRAVRRAG